MANVIKYKTTQPTKRGRKRGNLVVGTGNEGYGPTSTTGYVNGITPPDGGYVVYTLDGTNPNVYVADSDDDLPAIARTLGGGELTSLEAKNYIAGLTHAWIIDSVPNNTITDGLIFDLNAGDLSSFLDNEPTTNLASTDTARTMERHGGSSYNHGVTFSNAPERGEGWKKAVITEIGSNFRIAQFPYLSQPDGETRTYSVYYDFNSNSGYYWKVDGNTGMPMDTDDGYRTSRTYINNTGTSRNEAIFLCNNNTNTPGLNDTIYYKFYQVETQPQVTGFTTSSRSQNSLWYDLSGNGYNASSSSDTSYVEYNSNINCFDFKGGEVNGHGLFIQDLNYVTGNSDQLEELTIDTLIKTTSGNSGNSYDQRIILSFDRSAVFRFALGGDSGNANNPGRMSFMFMHGGSQADVSSGTSYDLRDDKWHRIALTFKSGAGNGIKYYVDGEQVHHDTNTYGNIGDHNDSESPRYGVIGAGSEKTNDTPGSSTAPDAIFDGSIASIKYYDKRLSESEINQNYYGGPIVTDSLTFAMDVGNLVSHESGSTIAYSLTGSYSGSFINGPIYSQINGGAVKVDGTNDYILVNGLPTGNTWTIQLWSLIKTTQSSFSVTGHRTYAATDNFRFQWDDKSTNIAYAPFTDFVSPGGSVIGFTNKSEDDLFNKWNLVTMTCDGSNVRLYFNSDLSPNTTGARNFSSDGVMRIGIDGISGIGGSDIFNRDGGDGYFGPVMVYDKALSHSEVLQNFNAQKTRFGL